MSIKPHEQARAWRKALGLSLEKLSELSGYSVVSINWMEWGKTPPRTAAHIAGKQKSKAIPGPVWKRYVNVCAGVESQLRNGKQFNWGE
jgi:hypothetical protein